MPFSLLNLLLSAEVSSEIARNSAIGMLGSFIAAGALIVAPAAILLITISSNDAISR